MVLSCDNIILTISHLFVVVNMSYLTSTVTRKVHMTFIMIFTELRHTKPTLEVPDCQERNTKTDQPMCLDSMNRRLGFYNLRKSVLQIKIATPPDSKKSLLRKK